MTGVIRTEDLLGEGFAFFHWVISGYKTGRCKPESAGWHCLYCRDEWKEGKR